MSFGIQNPFRFQSNIGGSTAADQTAAVRPAQTAQPQSGTQLPVGSVISGQVVDAKDDTVTIRTQQGQTIEARTEEGISLTKGSFVSFEVSGASDSQISLKALFTNTAAGSSTMSAALSQAGIPETGTSFGMVRSMMENGMPIDKASVQAMFRQVSAHPEAGFADLVDMTKLGLPLTEDNIGQFQAYRNLEHQISAAVDDVTASLTETVDALFAEGDSAGAVSFFSEVANLLTEGETESGAFLKLVDQMAAGTLEGSAEETAAGAGKDAAPGAIPQDGAMAQQAQEAKDPAAALLKALSDAAARSGETENAAQQANGKIVISDGGVTASEGKELATLSEKMSDGELLRSVAKGLEELSQAEKTPENASRLSEAMKLLRSEPMKQLLTRQLSAQWRMDPQTVSQKEQVQEFYEKLRSQTGKLSSIVENAVGKEGRLYEQVTNINRNVDFMNQLNQTASYVQLPLKLNGEDAHGDLYVYTNKKNLAAADGKISAYLHLDMDHLGPVDVYVAMENQKVSTNFYLADDAMIDFISENIHILNDRLAERGYDMSCKVSMKEKEKTGGVMEEILEDHRDGFLIGSKSFDVRA